MMFTFIIRKKLYFMHSELLQLIHYLNQREVFAPISNNISAAICSKTESYKKFTLRLAYENIENYYQRTDVLDSINKLKNINLNNDVENCRLALPIIEELFPVVTSTIIPNIKFLDLITRPLLIKDLVTSVAEIILYVLPVLVCAIYIVVS